MSARMEVLPWERQSREGERRMRPSWPTATSGRGGPTRRRGYASARGPATSSRSSGGRRSASGDGGPAPGTTTSRPSATRSPAEEAAKWERRRLQALEDGWRTCRALRARLEQMVATPRGDPGRRPARAGPSDAGGHPRRRRDARGAQAGVVPRAVAVGLLDGGPAVEDGRRAGVGAAERGVAAPRQDRPLDGDGGGDQGLPGPPSPPRTPAPALNRLTSPCLTTARPTACAGRVAGAACPGSGPRPGARCPSHTATPRRLARAGLRRSGPLPPSRPRQPQHADADCPQGQRGRFGDGEVRGVGHGHHVRDECGGSPQA